MPANQRGKIVPLVTKYKKETFARHDPAVALASLFRPVTKGRRPLGVIFESSHAGQSMKFKCMEGLDSRDQSVLLTLISMLGIEGGTLNSESNGDAGRLLWSDLKPEGNATESNAIALTTSLYAVLNQLDWPTNGKGYQRLRDCIERLSDVRCHAKANGWQWSMQFLSYAVNDDGTAINIALNSRFAAALSGQHIRVSLDERKLLNSDVAQLTHAYLSAAINAGNKLAFMIDGLALKIWGVEPQNPSTQRSRRSMLVKALEEISGLHGWIVEMEGRGETTKATIKRPRIIENKVDSEVST